MEVNDIAKETVEVLKFTDVDFKSRISEKLLNLLEELSQKSTKEVKIDLNKKLNEQNISEECKDLLSLLYLNYYASENEKEEILKIWKENDNIYQKELEGKYDIDKIFEKNTQERMKKTEKSNIQEEVKMPAVIKETFLEKLINRIKKIFSR